MNSSHVTPRNTTKSWHAYGIYTLLTLAVMAPMLRPGFILTLDMVFTPHLPMPDTITSSYLFHAALHFLNFVIPADVLQKLLLCSVILVACIGMHRLVCLVSPVRQREWWEVYVAGIFYAINPYTYSRLMAGQYAVLLGYALLPWCIRLCITFGRDPGIGKALQLGAITALIGTVSIHTLGLVAIILVAGIGVAIWQRRQLLASYLRYGLVASGVVLIICGFWLVPLALGHGRMATTIQSFTAADSQAFQTAGGNILGRVGNVVRLQGFWAEARGLYILPQEMVVLWGLIALIILGLIAVGAVQFWRTYPALAIWFGVAGGVGFLFAVGMFGGLLAHVGYREPHKFTGLVALSYSVFLAYGAGHLAKYLRAKGDITYAVGVVGVMLLPLVFSRVMLWGCTNQLQPRHYPTSWADANELLNRDTASYQILFLPWHQYMSFTFAGRIIANPAPTFFDRPVIVSQDPEIGGAVSGHRDAEHAAIEQVLQNSQKSEDFSRQLTNSNIKYILLAKELDFRRYAFVQSRSGLRLVRDYPELTLYENTQWRKR